MTDRAQSKFAHAATRCHRARAGTCCACCQAKQKQKVCTRCTRCKEKRQEEGTRCTRCSRRPTNAAIQRHDGGAQRQNFDNPAYEGATAVRAGGGADQAAHDVANGQTAVVAAVYEEPGGATGRPSIAGKSAGESAADARTGQHDAGHNAPSAEITCAVSARHREVVEEACAPRSHRTDAEAVPAVSTRAGRAAETEGARRRAREAWPAAVAAGCTAPALVTYEAIASRAMPRSCALVAPGRESRIDA